jgi:MFS family permease
MGDATLYTVLPTHTEAAGIALSSVGIMLGVNRAVRLLFNGAAGLAYDHWPRRWLFIPALFIGAFSTAIYAATHGFWPLLIGRILWGLAWSGIWVGGATMILDVTTDRDRGRWTGLYQTWFFIGAASGSLLGGTFTDWVGYTMTMWIGASLTALGGMIALFLLPETRSCIARDKGNPTPSSNPQPLQPLTLPPMQRIQTIRLWHNSRIWLAVMLHTVNRLVISGVLAATMGLLAQNRLREMDLIIGVATLTGILTAGQTLFSMASAPLAGTLSDRMGSRWQVVMLSLIAGVVGFGLLAGNVLGSVLIGILLVAAVKGSVQSLATAMTGDAVSHRQRGRAIGLLHTIGDFASAVGPGIAYWLLPWLELSSLYIACAGIFALALAMGLRLHKDSIPSAI